MELELGLAPPNTHPSSLAVISGGCGELFGGLLGGGASGKRMFSDAFGGNEKAATTLPLFVRHGDGGGDDDGAGDGGGRETSSKRKRLVGWPPVKCAHRRGCGGVGSGYVKVMMQGVAIGRKVDVSLHASYEELLRTLARMFPTSAANNDGAEEEVTTQQQERGHGHRPYVVTYEDGDGDWLLVGDVPWEAFAKSVKRLKILA